MKLTETLTTGSIAAALGALHLAGCGGGGTSPGAGNATPSPAPSTATTPTPSRPRTFRNLRNDHVYREGRAVLNGEGRAVKNSDQRMMRALSKKTDFGAQIQHTSWLMHEYTTLERLSQAGVPVPTPLAASNNAVLMGYVGARSGAAPTLSEVGLGAGEADQLFQSVMQSIETMLREGVIHGDLSAYNLLYWEGGIQIIDFPQVTNPESNPNAYALFARDVARISEYFARQGVRHDSDAETMAQDPWQRCAVGV